jgi:hypothetical protein
MKVLIILAAIAATETRIRMRLVMPAFFGELENHDTETPQWLS